MPRIDVYRSAAGLLRRHLMPVRPLHARVGLLPQPRAGASGSRQRPLRPPLTGQRSLAHRAMEGGSEPVAAAFHGCRSAAGSIARWRTTVPRPSRQSGCVDRDARVSTNPGATRALIWCPAGAASVLRIVWSPTPDARLRAGAWVRPPCRAVAWGAPGAAAPAQGGGTSFPGRCTASGLAWPGSPFAAVSWGRARGGCACCLPRGRRRGGSRARPPRPRRRTARRGCPLRGRRRSARPASA